MRNIISFKYDIDTGLQLLRFGIRNWFSAPLRMNGDHTSSRGKRGYPVRKGQRLSASSDFPGRIDEIFNCRSANHTRSRHFPLALLLIVRMIGSLVITRRGRGP